MRRIKVRTNKSPKEMEEGALEALAQDKHQDEESLYMEESDPSCREEVKFTDSEGNRVRVYAYPEDLKSMKEHSVCDFEQDSIDDAQVSKKNACKFNQEDGKKAGMAILGEHLKRRREYEEQCIHEYESQKCAAHGECGTCQNPDCFVRDYEPDCNVCYDDSLSEEEQDEKLTGIMKGIAEAQKEEAEVLGLTEDEDGNYVPKPIDFDPRETVEMLRKNAIEAKSNTVDAIPEDLSKFYKRENRPAMPWEEATRKKVTESITDNGEMPKYEMVNHPKHYNKYSVEVIDMFERIYGAYLTAMWCEMTALKYRMRAGTKPTAPAEEDIEKEKWYLEKRNELMKRSIAGEHDNGAMYPYAGEKLC